MFRKLIELIKDLMPKSKGWERNQDVKRDKNLQIALLRAHYKTGGKLNG